jgi:hypothetical protein
VFVTIARWGLGLLGIVALGFFIYGGFLMLISSGRSEYVSKGKAILTGTFLGIVVVLTAFVLVNTLGRALGSKNTDLAGGADSCRKAGNSSLCSAVLENFCHDPVNSAGQVVALQNALNDKCRCNLAVDGCYGDQTATCVWFFKLANGMTVTDNPKHETANAALIAAAQNPASVACAEGVDSLPPDFPEPDPSLPPIEPGAGCCVTSDLNYPCLDTTAGYCELYEPPLDPGSSSRYTYASGSCESRSACARDFRCIDFRRSDEADACTDVGPTDPCPAGTIKQVGDCTSWPGF